MYSQTTGWQTTVQMDAGPAAPSEMPLLLLMRSHAQLRKDIREQRNGGEF